jgi:hypothetical protein
MKLIQILPSREIQILDPYLLGTYFSLKVGTTRSLLAKFYQISSFQDFPINFPCFQLIESYLNFNSNLILNLEKFL